MFLQKLAVKENRLVSTLENFDGNAQEFAILKIQ